MGKRAAASPKSKQGASSCEASKFRVILEGFKERGVSVLQALRISFTYDDPSCMLENL